MSFSASLPNVATFHESADGLTRLRISTDLADAELTLDGAHVTHFQPRGSEPVLFLSQASHFAPGKPIRGGIPVCFPWFSARAGHPESPAHGFARITRWSVESLTGSAAEGVTVVLRLGDSAATRALWPHAFVARLRVEVTRSLRLSFEVENPGRESLAIEAALHTYFAISDIHDVSVTGLEGADYLDKTDALQRKTLGSEPLRFIRETDWIFPGNTATCVIHDPAKQRRIVVGKSGSRSTVVWNPWIAKAAAMADFGDDEWPQMLCIETANAGADAITIAPGASHAMSTRIHLE